MHLSYSSKKVLKNRLAIKSMQALANDDIQQKPQLLLISHRASIFNPWFQILCGVEMITFGILIWSNSDVKWIEHGFGLTPSAIKKLGIF